MLCTPSFTHDHELLVYCLTELNFQVIVPLFEMPLFETQVNYINATFTTSEVIQVVSRLLPIADLVESDLTNAPFARMTKTAPGSWLITLAGNDTTLEVLLSTIHQNGIHPDKREKTFKVAHRQWVSSFASPSFSYLQLTSPALLDEVTPYTGNELRSRDFQTEQETIKLLISKVTYIIGLGGGRIEEIRRSTGCLIKIPALPKNQLNVMNELPRNEATQEMFLEGTSVQLAEAKSIIRRLLADHKQGYRSERGCTHLHSAANASNEPDERGSLMSR